MIRQFFTISVLFFLPIFSFSQVITYSDPLKDDGNSSGFDIVGKVGGNLLILKNVPSNFALSVYDNQMKVKETVPLDFLPEKTFNANFIAYPDFIYLIYQYQKKKTVYCAAIKLDADAKVLTQPFDIDSTDIGNRTNRIYKTIYSEDKQKIMLVKTQRQNENLTITTLLLNDQLQLIKKTQQDLSYNDDKNIYGNFSVDNDGDFLFTISERASGREYFNQLNIVTKPSMADSFAIHNIDLKGKYTDDIHVKIDNINKHYILNSFFYNDKRGNTQGIYADTWDKQTNSPLSNLFISFDDSIRVAIKKSRNKKEALNDLAIRNVNVKKDGGYLLMAEDYYVQKSSDNGLSPWGFGYGPFNPAGYNNIQTATYHYNNVFVISIDKNGNPEWNSIISKNQSSYNGENALSYTIFNTGGEIHLLFNETEKRSQTTLSDKSITASGDINTNTTIKLLNNMDYQFLPRFGKQVGSKQIIIPCTYRNSICFAKIDY
jgi:VCBS repeat-containing protein